jgi:hypothetical protein
MIIDLRAVQGEIFIRLLLKKMDFVRAVLVQEVEQGAEVFIPKSLS